MQGRPSNWIQAAWSWCGRPPQSEWLGFLFAFSPAMVTACLIAANAVNVPVWDGWERGVLLEKAKGGELDLGYLTSAHIDHRPLVPRVITLFSNSVSGGDVRSEIWLGYLAVVAGAFGLWRVLRMTLPHGSWSVAAAFAVNLLLFSPLQYQNFLWATQLSFLLPLGCLGLLLAVMASRIRPAFKFVAASALALVASFSFGHGLILWPVAFCMALMHPVVAELRVRAVLATGFAAIATAVLLVYFNWNYINTSQPWHAYGALPGEPPPAVSRMDNLSQHPERVLAYFWSSLGNPVARLLGSDPLLVSGPAGRGLMVGFCIALLSMLVMSRREGAWGAFLPWAACAAFAVVAALMMASGRGADLPLERSILPRYSSLTGYLPIGLIGMAAVALYQLRDRGGGGIALVSFGLLAGLQSQAFVYGAHKMSAWKTARLSERFQLLYVKHTPPRFPSGIDGGMAAGGGETPFAVRQALFLDREGWLDPPLFEGFDFGSFTKLPKRALVRDADLKFAQVPTGGALRLGGHATLPDGRIADGLLVTWRPAGDGKPPPVVEKDRGKERVYGERIAAGDWQVFGILSVHAAPAMRASFEDGQFGANKMNASKRENFARFDDPVGTDALPEGREVEVLLWVADCERMEVAPLKRTLRFTKGAASAGEVVLQVE